jgi:hypothetical protein
MIQQCHSFKRWLKNSIASVSESTTTCGAGGLNFPAEAGKGKRTSVLLSLNLQSRRGGMRSTRFVWQESRRREKYWVVLKGKRVDNYIGVIRGIDDT